MDGKGPRGWEEKCLSLQTVGVGHWQGLDKAAQCVLHVPKHGGPREKGKRPYKGRAQSRGSCNIQGIGASRTSTKRRSSPGDDGGVLAVGAAVDGVVAGEQEARVVLVHGLGIGVLEEQSVALNLQRGACIVLCCD